MPAYQRIPGAQWRSEYVGLYDGDIASADAEIGRLVAALRARGWYERATIVPVADHGESLGENGLWFEHGRSTADGEARVPLILNPSRSTPGQPAAGTRVAVPVSVVDVFPTLLAAAGAPLPADAAGRDLAAIAGDGRRLLAPPTTAATLPSSSTLAVHPADCSPRWRLQAAPAAAGGSDPWPDAPVRATALEPRADAACTAAAHDAVADWVADRFTYELPLPVTFRGDAQDHGARTRSVRERDPQVALTEAEREALRQLGYLE